LSGTQYGLPLQIETKRLDGDEWTVSGYASTYDRDLGDDVVQPGAFQKSLGNGRPVRFLYGHDQRQVLGKTLELKEDERGLFGRFAISKTALGTDVRTLLKDGALDSFSIGYLPGETEFDKKAGVRKIKELELLEVSVVGIPMNPGALVTSVKAADYAAMPLDDVLAALTEHRTAALAAVKALCERRRGEGRKLSDRAIELMEALRAASLKDADDLLAYLTTAPAEAAVEAPGPTQSPEEAAPAEAAAPAEVPATAKAAGLVEAHLRRARFAAAARKYADVVLPEYDPVAHLERLEPRDPLEGYR
jgi:hypothetical protein